MNHSPRFLGRVCQAFAFLNLVLVACVTVWWTVLAAIGLVPWADQPALFGFPGGFQTILMVFLVGLVAFLPTWRSAMKQRLHSREKRVFGPRVPSPGDAPMPASISQNTSV